MEVDDKKEVEGADKDGADAAPAAAPADAEKKEGEKATDKMETEDPKKEVKMEKRKKMVNKTVDLAVCSRVQGQLSYDRLTAASTDESAMAKGDRDEADRLVAKNSVEEYIYGIRGMICDELEDFMLEEDRNTFSLELEDAENWLYEDGEYANKPQYSDKLTALKSKGEAVKRRRKEFNERPEAINQFGQCMQLAQKAVDSFKSGDDKFNHLDTAEVDKVQKAIQEKQEWFSRMCADVQKMEKHSDPPVLAVQFIQEKESFWHMASNILNKPKPKVEPPPPPPAEAPTKEESMDTASETAAGEATAASDAPKEATKAPEMDVD